MAEKMMPVMRWLFAFFCSRAMSSQAYIGNRDSDQMRAAVVDGSRQPVGAVIQLLCGQLNFFDCCRRNPEFSGIAVEDSCNR